MTAEFSGIVGRFVRTFKLAEYGTLIMYLSEQAESGPDLRLWIDCAWRVRIAGKIAIGSRDDLGKADECLNNLTGQVIKEAVFEAKSKDLCLRIGHDTILESFSNYTEDDVWEVRYPDGQRLSGVPNQQKS